MIYLYFCLQISIRHIMKKQKSKRFVAISCAVLVVVCAAAYWSLFTPFSSSSKTGTYIYIDADDTADSVYAKLAATAAANHLTSFRVAAALSGYSGHVHPGCYETAGGVSTLRLLRNLRSGRQTPVRLVVPAVRTMGDMARRLSRQLAADSASLAAAFSDSALCATVDCSPATLPCIFVPETYEVLWTVSPDELVKRMKKESDKFWNASRKGKAEKQGLSPQEVVTLASIVDQETANDAEKPMVAGMYLNRLRQGMKLQADPTVKFALGDFGLRRILHEHLTVDSPYNTYRNAGLPPGPIAVPQISSIDAVLNAVRHDYLYMCAKEDFSGTHNFAVTYEEHLANAARYTRALNERNIH